MTRSVKVRDTAHWHELRSQHVGSSECAALFGEHPHITGYELWHVKAGKVPAPDLSEDERVQWGLCMEPAIAHGVRLKTGWHIQKCHRYYTMMPELRAGASLDYEILGHPKGPGVLEIKTADWLVAKRWGAGPPIHYELQVQHALACCNRRWGVMAICVGGNELRLYEYEARPATIALIQRRVADFWASIEADTPPHPDYALDHDTIARLYGDTEIGKYMDLSDNARLAELLAEYEASAGMRRRYEREAKALRAEIMMAIGDAAEVRCGDWRLKASTIAGTRGTVITADMVGRELKGREGYRSLWVGRRQGEQAA